MPHRNWETPFPLTYWRLGTLTKVIMLQVLYLDNQIFASVIPFKYLANKV